MTSEELKQLHMEAAKEGGELFAKHYINKTWDPSVAAAMLKAKDLIPGEQFDFIVDIVGSAIFPELKKQLLGQVDSISAGV